MSYDTIGLGARARARIRARARARGLEAIYYKSIFISPALQDIFKQSILSLSGCDLTPETATS